MNNHPANAAHTGHTGNSGIQNHSVGEFFPVRTVLIGSADHRRAVAFGVERDSFNAADHTDNLRRMKLAEGITDAIFAARSDGSGHSHWFGCKHDPVSGYVVGSAGNESIFDAAARNYNAVYADVVEKLEFLVGCGVDLCSDYLVRPVCIGSWVHDGKLYVDISAYHPEFEDALEWGRANDQIAIWDIAAGKDYPC